MLLASEFVAFVFVLLLGRPDFFLSFYVCLLSDLIWPAELIVTDAGQCWEKNLLISAFLWRRWGTAPPLLQTRAALDVCVPRACPRRPGFAARSSGAFVLRICC